MRSSAILLVIFSLLLFSCNGETKKENQKMNSKNNIQMRTIQLTKEEFNKKVANIDAASKEWKYLGDRPAIIDFYADWCGPCKRLAPVLEELAAEYEGQIYIYKVDTEVEQELAASFQIRSIPSLLFIPMEGAPQMSQGAMPKSSLKEAIDAVLIQKK